MTEQEYKDSKAAIIAQYGTPEWELNNPVNECATKLFALRNAYLKHKEEVKQTKRLANTVRAITENVSTRFVPIPEEVIRHEWLVAFNEKQQRIVKQWSTNIKQTPKQIADALNIPTEQVRNTMSLEAFHLLRRHLTLGAKELLPLESILAIRDVLASSNDATKLKAALTVLIDQGFIKAQVDTDTMDKTSVALDNETLERLRKLGNELI